MSVRKLETLQDAVTAVQEGLQKNEQSKGWMVGIWRESHNGDLELHRTSFKFSSALLEKALFLFARDLVEDENMLKGEISKVPLNRAHGFDNPPNSRSKLFPAEFFPNVKSNGDDEKEEEVQAELTEEIEKPSEEVEKPEEPENKGEAIE